MCFEVHEAWRRNVEKRFESVSPNKSLERTREG